MKVTQLLLLVLSFFIVNATPTEDDWGQTGHRVVGEVASHYLNKKAKRAILKLLDGASLAYVSTYPDEIKSDEHFDSYSPWHYINMPIDANYDINKANPEGDLYQGIQKCIQVLKDKSASKEDKQFHLKLLVHFIGDLHQPMHMGKAEDRGGNGIRLKWFGRNTNLHTVWDSNIIDYFDMSYTEWTSNLPTLSWEQQKSLQSGTLANWIEESHDLAATIYHATKEGDNLRYEYTYVYKETVREQLLKAGVRLAGILNDIL